MDPRSLIRSIATALETHMCRFRPAYEVTFLALAIAAFYCWLILFVPPLGFPRGEIVLIEEGESVRSIAYELAERRVIGSPLLFILAVRALGYEDELRAGPYSFGRHYGLLSVVYRIGHGLSGIPPSRVWLPEGMTVLEMGETLSAALPAFDKQRFYDKALPREGYLFPDTYLIFPDETADDIVERLHSNFLERLKEVEAEIAESGLPLSDIITMASLLEREARSLEEKRMVAGVLWHRLEIDMPLQVDAVFGYIQNRETYHPTLEDLEIDSPYNTYLYKGLPPGPIANPGLESILAAVTPTETQALYYLTGRDGVTRYARTFAEHKQNRALYLD